MDFEEKEYNEIVNLLKEVGAAEPNWFDANELLQIRSVAKYKKDYAMADKIRDLLIKFNYKIKDRKNNTSEIIDDEDSSYMLGIRFRQVYMEGWTKCYDELTREHKYKLPEPARLEVYMCKLCGRLMPCIMGNQQCPRCDEFNNFVKLVPEK